MKQERTGFLERHPYILPIASACIPCILLTVSLMVLRIAPFGDNTLLLLDSKGQYLDYISYLKTIFTGENDLIYTFSKNLGGDVISLASYYLLSPFNLLFAFSNSGSLPLFYTAVVILKLSCCGFTMYYALEKQFGAKGSHLIFSTAYALMSYNVLYEWNIMWLDGVLILPLLGQGVYSIWKGRSCKLYMFSLAYALATNFYIGYMLCIASVIFSLVYCILFEGGRRERFGRLGKYIFASCISGFGTAFVWVPAFLNLRKGGRAQFGWNVFRLRPNFSLSELASKLVVGSGGPEQVNLGLPHIFCGTFVLFWVAAFFLNKRFSRKHRFFAFGTVMVFLCSFYVSALDVVWHGFSPNNLFNYRYSFIFSYVLIMIACHAFSRPDTSRFRAASAGTLVLGILILALLRNDSYVLKTGIGISLAVLIITYFHTRIKDKTPWVAACLILTVSILEIGANCGLLLNSVVGKTATLKLAEYGTYVQTTEPAVDYVKNRDSGFYRMEKTFQRSHNDPMFYGYNGLSHFSSSEQFFVPQFLQKMGLKNYDDVWAYYNQGSTAEVDALLGVKYVLSKTDLSATKGYKLLTKIDDVGIYENSHALPLAMVSDQRIVNVAMDEQDYFALHNAIWNGISGLDGDVLQAEQKYTCSVINLIETTDEKGNHIYTKLDDTLPASVRYDMEISQENPLYFYFSAPKEQDASVFINGIDDGAYFDTYRWDMSTAGKHSVGDHVTIEIVPGGRELVITQPYFYYEDRDQLAQQVSQIRMNGVQMERVSSSYLTGTAYAEKDGVLMFSIPYDTGWKLCIDGKETQLVKVLDTFAASELPAGHHTFTLRYIPRGTSVGCLLTLLALVMALLWFVKNNRARMSCPFRGK